MVLSYPVDAAFPSSFNNISCKVAGENDRLQIIDEFSPIVRLRKPLMWKLNLQSWRGCSVTLLSVRDILNPSRELGMNRRRSWMKLCALCLLFVRQALSRLSSNASEELLLSLLRSISFVGVVHLEDETEELIDLRSTG